MKSGITWFLFLCAVTAVMCTHYSLENPEIVYYNEKYLKDPIFTVTKNGDDYVIHCEGENLVEFGDNVSTTMAFLKKVNDVYESTPLKVTFTLCKFLENKWGQLVMKQLGKKLDCPFPAKRHVFTGNAIKFEQIPYADVLLDPSWKKGIRLETTYFVTDTKELILNSTILMMIH